MRKKIQKIFMFLIIFFSVICFNNGTKAATADISANNNNVEVGDTITVTVTATAGSWNLSINGGGLTSSDTSGLVGQTNTTANSNASKTYTFTANKAGKYTIALNGDITDYDTDENVDVNKSVSITVNEKQNNTDNNGDNNSNAINNNSNNSNNSNVNNNSNAGNNKNTNNNNNTTQTPAQKDEPTFQTTNETVYVTQTVNVRDTYSTSGNKVATLNIGDSVTRIGIGSNGWDKVTYNGKTAYMIHSALSTQEPKKEEEKSSNKSLKELVVENYQITPEFDAKTTKYSLTLNDTDEELKITATPEDEKSTVSITDNGNFKVGNNIVKITVTAEDGTTRMYTITVSKTNENGVAESLKLSKLEIANSNLEPAFDPETTNYIIFAEDPSTIKAENIIATSDDKDVIVTTAENEQSENDEKIITIMLESKDGNKTGIYQITVKKPIANQEVTLTNSSNNSIYYILGAIIVVLIFLIILIIIALKVTGNKDNDEEEDDELSDDYSLNSTDNDDEYDNMVQQSGLQSKILDTDIDVSDDIDDSPTTVFDNSNFQNDVDISDDSYDEDYKPNLKSNKKGKHF